MLSICIFGSQARQTADAISDRDVLIVGSPSLAFDSSVARWTAQEWNVSVFNRPAFERIAEVKALFIQHLKQEGRVLYDDDQFLNSVLERYSPKADYSAERNDALMQIAVLPQCTGIYWHDLCLADIFYVLFRNSAILHLACAREYSFQYNLLVERMVALFGLNEREHLTLLSLRHLKYGYRQRVEGLTIQAPLQAARQVVMRIIERLPDMTASSIATGITTDDYYKLRMTELALVTKLHPNMLDILEPESSEFTLWQRIRCGGGYPKPGSGPH